LTIPSILKL